MKNIMEDIISNWKDNFKHNILLITGESNTLFIDYDFLNENYNLLKLSYVDFKKNKDIDKMINTFLFYNNFFNTYEKLILIDNIDVVSSKTLTYIKKKFIKKKIKCIFISNGESFKIKKYLECHFDEHYYKKQNNNKDYLNKLIRSENVFFEYKLKKYILDISNNNIEKINNIFDLLLFEKNEKYTLHDSKEVIDFFYNDFNNKTKLFNMVSELFVNDCDIKKINNFYNIEKTQLPLTIHHNYYKFLNQHNDKILKLKKISNNFSEGEVINSFIYKKQKYYMTDNISIIECYYPSKILHMKKNKIIDISFSNLIATDSYKIRNHNAYYNLLSSTNITNYDKYKILSNFNYILLLLLSTDYKKGIELLNTYNLTIKDINKLLTITGNNLKIKQYFNQNYLTFLKYNS